MPSATEYRPDSSSSWPCTTSAAAETSEPTEFRETIHWQRYVLRVNRSDEETAGWVLDLRGRIDELVNEYRSSLHDCLERIDRR